MWHLIKDCTLLKVWNISSHEKQVYLMCCSLEVYSWKHCKPLAFFENAGCRIWFCIEYRRGLGKDAKSIQLRIFTPDSCLCRTSTSHKIHSITLHCISWCVFSGEGLCCYWERNTTFIQERIQSCIGAWREEQCYQGNRRHIPDCI